MKKLLLSAAGVAGAAVVVVGGAAAANSHYQDHQNKQHQAQVSQVEAVKKAQYAADKQQFDVLATQYNSAVAECEKGVTAYGKLSAVLKVQTPSPKCPTPVTQ